MVVICFQRTGKSTSTGYLAAVFGSKKGFLENCSAVMGACNGAFLIMAGVTHPEGRPKGKCSDGPRWPAVLSSILFGTWACNSQAKDCRRTLSEGPVLAARNLLCNGHKGVFFFSMPFEPAAGDHGPVLNFRLTRYFWRN